MIKKEQWDAGHGRFTSDTGQIQMAAGDGTFVVDTPQSHALILTKAGSLKTSCLEVKDCSTAATFFLGALDQNDIASSNRMVLMHLSDVTNTNMKFADQHRRVLENWGQLPLLVERSTATLTITLKHPNQVTVYTVDLSGQRIEKMVSAVKGNQLILKVDTASSANGVMAYELTRNP